MSIILTLKTTHTRKTSALPFVPTVAHCGVHYLD